MGGRAVKYVLQAKNSYPHILPTTLAFPTYSANQAKLRSGWSLIEPTI